MLTRRALLPACLTGCVLSLGAQVLPACSPAPAEAAGKPNVLLILVDTMRADSLGPYGYTKRKTTPNLDEFAKGALVWDNVVSQDAWTVPSVASLFTGVDPQAHRTLRFQVKEHVEMDTMSEMQDTIAEAFHAGGYTTSAFIKSTVIDSSRGFSQGFDAFNIVGGTDQAWGNSARDLNNAAIPALKAQQAAGKPWFTYMHFMDPHSPYKAPEPWYSKYKGAYAGKMDGAHVQIEAAVKDGSMTAEDWVHERDLYDAEVEYWDSEFGRLWKELDAAGIPKNTLVVLVADHGEGFWEHGNFFHGNLYQENIHVPIFVRGPGVKAGRMKQWAQLIDIDPTLADLCGLAKGKSWMGKSMLPAFSGGAGHSDVLYSEYVDQRMVIEPSTGLKLIVNDGPDKLYDLKNDPLEKSNLAGTRTADVSRLKPLLDARFLAGKALGQSMPTTKANQLSDEQKALLIQLGYIEDDDADGKVKATTAAGKPAGPGDEDADGRESNPSQH